MKKLLLAILLSLSLVTPVLANRTNPLDLSNPSSISIQSDSIIEKQNDWPYTADPDYPNLIVNPTIGTWDINDHFNKTSSGYLDPGTSTSTNINHIFDFNPIYKCNYGYCAWWSAVSNRFGANIIAPSDKLLVTTCYSPQNYCFTATPIWDATNKIFRYTNCSNTVYTSDDPAVIVIPNSNGGRGVPTVITLTIKNTNTQTGEKYSIKNIQARWGISSDVVSEPGCENLAYYSNIEANYPFIWWL